MRKLLLSLLTIIFMISLVGVASAQAPDSVSIGKLYVLQSEWIDLYTNPSTLAPVATKIPQGFIVRVVAGPQEVDGVNWWYITTSNYGWIPELIDNLPTLELFSTELLEQTIAETSQTLTNDPQDIAALFQRAMAYYGLRNYDASIADFDAAIALDDTVAYLYGWRAFVYLDSYSFYEAESDYSKAIALDTTEPMYFIRRGVAFENTERSYDAEDDYRRANEIVPTYAVPINNIGNILRAEGSYALATSQYEEAMELDPHYGRPYSNRALVKQNQGDYIGALDDYGRALAIDPYDPTTYNYRGELLNDYFGNSSAAINDFTSAIELDPDYADAYVGRGVAYGLLSNEELAISDIKRGIELNPSDAYAYYNLAKVYAQLGRFEEALDSYNHVAPLNRDLYEDSLLYSGQIQVALGNYTEAVTELTIYMDRVSGYYFNLVARMTRASAYAYLGNYEKAASDLEYAYYTDYQFTIEFAYASGYRVTEDQGSRASVVRDELTQNPNDASLYLELANIYLEAGLWDNALDYYQQYVTLVGSDKDNLGVLIGILQTVIQ